MILDCEDGYYLADPEIMDAYVNGNKALVTEAVGNGTAVTAIYSLAVSSGLHGQVESFLDGSDVTRLTIRRRQRAAPIHRNGARRGKERREIYRSLRHPLGCRRHLHRAGIKEKSCHT